ncbi:hypothetical protein Patl1_16140 [Pistacia atlantica]|uniref:Uncharacterized protein n=1 Tax=Pistacia atlantica TaxID=434234 RepID=A0ACC1B5B1_9ROSI|nr:hypothetical protein Patl1_16140 [Pistacia atlantica]
MAKVKVKVMVQPAHRPLQRRVNLPGLASPIKTTTASRLSSLHKRTYSRLPVELGGALSLMPLHSVTASALFTSLLSLNNQNWGCLSEGTLLFLIFYGIMLVWYHLKCLLYALCL